MILANLRPQHVTQVRLTCALLAEIGLKHLLSEVHLIFKSSSFDRMRQISQHPIVSQTVRSLFYEAEVMERSQNFDAWKECIENPIFLADLAITHPRDRKSSAFLRRRQEQQESPRPCRSEEELRRAYASYGQYAADQQMIIRHKHNSDLIQNAIRRFPYLDSVHMVRERHVSDCSRYLVREFEAGMQIPYDRQVYQKECGVSQLLSLLLGAVSTGRILRRVTCDQIHWTFFTQSREVLAQTYLAVEHLNSLRLRIAPYSQGIYSNAMCANLQHGSLRDFIAAAARLKDLNIGSHPAYRHWPPIFLAHAVGTRHWQYLERVTFTYLSTSEEDLLRFCDSHAKNMVHFSIIGMTLTTGCWQRVFQHIRKALRLRSVEVSDILSSYDLNDRYNLDKQWGGLEPAVPRKTRLRAAIEAYLLEGGDAAPMNLDSALYDSDAESNSSYETSSNEYTDSLDEYHLFQGSAWVPRT